MNGIAKIIERIEADAAVEVAEIKAQADETVAQIDKQFKQEAMDAYLKIVEEGKADAERLSERTYNSAVMQSKKQLLAAKQQLLSDALSLAEAELLKLPADKYAALLAKLSAYASISGDEKLIFNEADRERVGEKVVELANKLLAAMRKTANLSVAAETREISGGVIVSGGNIETNCSANALINQRHNEFSAIAVKYLFE